MKEELQRSHRQLKLGEGGHVDDTDCLLTALDL